MSYLTYPQCPLRYCNIFIFEFKLFCNENQFFKYLDKSLTNQVNYFVRKNIINDNKIISLNTITSSDIEYIVNLPKNIGHIFIEFYRK